MEFSKVVKCDPSAIQQLRQLFLHESNFHSAYDHYHQYGWVETYLFMADDIQIGYGCIAVMKESEKKDTIFELYLLPPFRKFAYSVYILFSLVSNASFVECQTNDLLLTSLLYEFTTDINVEYILFEDHVTTALSLPDVTFHKTDSEYVLERNGEIVATGGYVKNCNPPYVDIHMEVKEAHQQEGLGSLMAQELKREIYLMDKVPAARCPTHHQQYKKAFLKAGFKVCGYTLKGNVRELYGGT